MEKQKNIYGCPRDQPLPDMSLGEFLWYKMREIGDAVFLVNEDNQLTINDVLRDSTKLANFLKRHGVKIEDRICIISENRLNWFIPVCASIYIGAIFVPYNPLYTEWELQNMLNISKPRIAFVSQRTEELIRKIQLNLSWQMELIQLDDKPLEANIRTLRNILDNEEVINDQKYNGAIITNIAKQPAVILSSSGTTGLPKGVTLSHKNLLAFVIEINKRNMLDVRKDDRILLFLPFYHGYAFGLLLTCLTIGTTIIMITGFELERFIQQIEKYKPTILPVVPSIMTLLAKHPLLERYNFTSVRQLICGAAPFSKELVTVVKARTGIKYIRHGYGMTEVTMVSYLSDYNADDIIPLHNIIPGMYSKIVDSKTLETVGIDCVGEICLKGDQVMLGYWNNSEVTKQTIDKDEWLHTGDLGYHDANGVLYVVDRLKELIKYKGYQVSPSEIEMVLLSYPAVKEAAVYGKPDPRSGELPAAVIVKQPGITVTAQEIIKFVKQKLSPQKWLRGGVQFVDAIPKNSTGKILRHKIPSIIQTTASKL